MAKFDKEKAIEELKALGVELTGEEKVADLKALLAEHAPDSSDDDSDDSDDDDEGGDEKGSFKVSDSNGKVVATAKSRKEADELAKVYGGKVIKA